VLAKTSLKIPAHIQPIIQFHNSSYKKKSTAVVHIASIWVSSHLRNKQEECTTDQELLERRHHWAYALFSFARWQHSTLLHKRTFRTLDHIKNPTLSVSVNFHEEHSCQISS